MGVELVLTDSPELAGQKLLDSLPDGAELETTTKRTKDGWVATACIHAPWDSVRPEYLGRGATEDEALLKALAPCAHFWEWRAKKHGSNC